MSKHPADVGLRHHGFVSSVTHLPTSEGCTVELGVG